MFSLKNKVAVITGGGSGIGKAISILFAQQGAHVHIIELNVEAAAETIGNIRSQGGHAVAHVCNVEHQTQVKEIIDSIEAIHILVNNAGIAHIGNAENTNEADFDRVFSVNVKGFYNCIHSVIPTMREGGGGSIINLASVAASVGLSDRFAYSMSKGAVVAMTLSTAKDFIKHNIRCNSISPARVHTPFVDGFLAKNYAGKEAEMFEILSHSQPIGRMAQPAEIAALALYLCSDEASFITGTDYPIDGGFITLNN